MDDIANRALQVLRENPFMTYQHVEEELGLEAGSLAGLLAGINNLVPEDFHYETCAFKQRPCPDCGGALLTRTSERVHPLLVIRFLACQNLVCGSTFKAREEIVSRVSVPHRPNPAIRLPGPVR